MAKRPVLHDWEMSRMFGVPVVRGLINGECVTVPWVYWDGRMDKPQTHRLGLSRGGRGAEMVVAFGRPARDPFPIHPRLAPTSPPQ